jgi:hypothetical protein
MSAELIDTLNVASRLAALWRSGEAAAVVVQDLLVDLGFYAVVFERRHIVARLRGVRFELGDA